MRPTVAAPERAAATAGFGTERIEGATLRVGEMLDLAVGLRVVTAETVTVVSELPPTLDTADVTSSQRVLEDVVDGLPSDGRNFMSLTLLTPGASISRAHAVREQRRVLLRPPQLRLGILMRKPEQDSRGARGGPRTTRARLPFWSMSIVNIRSLVRSAVAAALVLAAPAAASAQMEFHYQYGKLVNPFSGDGVASSILTIQQAAAWSLGESFFFIDYLDDNRPDGFNDVELYGEWYPTLSLSRISRRQVGAGPLRDVQLIGGINFGGDADFFKYLPGARLSWDVPGFVFFNTDITAFIDANNGVAEGGARGAWSLLALLLALRRAAGVAQRRGAVPAPRRAAARGGRSAGRGAPARPRGTSCCRPAGRRCLKQPASST